MLRFGFGDKLQIYILTFVCYVSVHALRTAYSFTKHYLPEAIGVEKSWIGLVDSLLLLCLGAGHFLHALYPVEKPVKTLWIGMFGCAISYALIPFCIDSHLNNLTALSILMSINGFLQSYTWPNLLMIVKQKWDQKKNPAAMGFWPTNTNIGNIVGYLICTEFVMALNFPWQMGMYIAAAFSFIAGVLILARIEEIETIKCASGVETEEDKKARIQHEKQAKEHIDVRAVFHEPNVLLLTIAFSLVKSVIYGIMLWLPLYFYDIGLERYSTFIPITYDFASILGSVYLGYLFSKVTVKSRILAPAMLVLVALFFAMKYFHAGIVGYFVIIFGVGLCLGGSFNTMSGLVVMELSKVVPVEYQTICLGFYSALTMSIANITTALTQLLIGYIVGKDEQQIFIIFMGYSALALICFLILSQIETLKAKTE